MLIRFYTAAGIDAFFIVDQADLTAALTILGFLLEPASRSN